MPPFWEVVGFDTVLTVICYIKQRFMLVLLLGIKNQNEQASTQPQPSRTNKISLIYHLCDAARWHCVTPINLETEMVIYMFNQCPQCYSTRVVSLNSGRKVFGVLGTVLGAIAGISLVIASGGTGSAGALARTSGTALVLGNLGRAMSSGVINGVIGGQAGIALGRMLDDDVLDNYECLKCSHTFKKDKAPNSASQSAA